MDSAIHHGEATKKINHGIPRTVLECHARINTFIQSSLGPAIQGAFSEAATQSLSLDFAQSQEQLTCSLRLHFLDLFLSLAASFSLFTSSIYT
jgi:hypothetical protein